jgi:hypothetical protein
MLCDAFTRFRLLSVRVVVPVTAPPRSGAKLIGSVQLAEGASEPASKDVTLTIGQAVEPVLLSVKLAVVFGFVPVAGMENRSGALPMLATVEILGLSELVAPTLVVA